MRRASGSAEARTDLLPGAATAYAGATTTEHHSCDVR